MLWSFGYSVSYQCGVRYVPAYEQECRSSGVDSGCDLSEECVHGKPAVAAGPDGGAVSCGLC